MPIAYLLHEYFLSIEGKHQVNSEARWKTSKKFNVCCCFFHQQPGGERGFIAQDFLRINHRKGCEKWKFSEEEM